MEKVILDNGVTLLLQPSARFRSAACAFCALGGLSDEDPGEVGISHLLEHLLFKRTTRWDNRTIAATIDRLGGDVNAFTDLDSMCLFGSVPAGRCQTLFEFLASLLLECAFTVEDLALEREVIRQEILEAEDNPLDLLYQRMSEMVWADSMFRFPVFGTLDVLARLTLDQVRDRLARTVRGRRIVVAVAGNIDPEQVKRWAHDLLGALPPGDRPPVVRPRFNPGLLMIERPVRQVHVALSCPWVHLKDPRAVAGGIIATALGDGSSSRLFQQLRERHGLVYDAGTQVDSAGDSAALIVSATLDPLNAGRALELILGELEEIRIHSLEPAELERVREMMSSHLQMEGDRLSSLLWRTIESELNFGRFIGVDDDLAELNRVAAADLAAVAERFVAAGGYALTICGDVGSVTLPKSLRQLTLPLIAGPLESGLGSGASGSGVGRNGD